MVALVCGAIAVLSANLSAIVPLNVLEGLHRTRIEGATLDQLRMQVADMRDETNRLRLENSTMLTRFSLQEQTGNEVVQRVGALEVSLPKLLEAIPDSAGIDPETTASIGQGDVMTYDADGGSVSVHQQPMAAMPTEVDQVMPAPLTPAPPCRTRMPLASR